MAIPTSWNRNTDILLNKDTVNKPSLLLLDDEERILSSLKTLFKSQYEVYTATCGTDALEILKQKEIAIVISDQRMPVMTGIEFLREAKEVSPNTIRILLTGFSDLQAIIGSINEGEVYRYLNKPWSNKDILNVVSDAVEVYNEITSVVKEEETDVKTQTASAFIEKNIVLIKSSDREFYDSIANNMSETITFMYAKDNVEALSILETNTVKVLVSSLDYNSRDKDADANFLKLLKQELPDLISIALVDKEGIDYQEIINLINEAKLYRYLLLPCSSDRIEHQIKSAILMANRIYNNPVLLRAQSVVRKSIDNPSAEEPTGNLFSRIKSLRKFWGK